MISLILTHVYVYRNVIIMLFDCILLSCWNRRKTWCNIGDVKKGGRGSGTRFEVSNSFNIGRCRVPFA